MLITFLVIVFSDLSFTDATVQGLLQWYNCHPFILILAIQDILLGVLVLFKLFALLIAFEEEEAEKSDFLVYRDDTNTWEKLNNKH